MPTTRAKKKRATINSTHSFNQALGCYLRSHFDAFACALSFSLAVYITAPRQQPSLTLTLPCTQFIGHFDIFRSHLIIMIRRHRHIARVSRLSDHFTASYSSRAFFLFLSSSSSSLRHLLFFSSTSSVVFQIYKYNLFIMMFKSDSLLSVRSSIRLFRTIICANALNHALRMHTTHFISASACFGVRERASEFEC